MAARGWFRASTINQASPRSSHSIVHHTDGNLYVLGGEFKPRVPIGSDISIYSLSNDSWKTVQPKNPPQTRVAQGVVSVGDSLYLFGGRNIDKKELGDIWKLNLPSFEWTQLHPSGPSPIGRSYHGLVSLQNKIYLFGGCAASGRQNDLWRYDPELNDWTLLPSENGPSARGGPAVVATDSAIYVIFGFNGSELDDIFAFDVNTETWREIKTTGDVPAPRSVHAAAYLGNSRVLLWGGEGAPSHLGHAGAGKHFRDGFVLHLDTNVWEKIVECENSPNPRGWLAATSIPGGAAIFGGLADDNERQADLFLYHP